MKHIVFSLLVIFFSRAGFSQNQPDTFAIVMSEKNIPYLKYKGAQLPSPDSLINSADFTHKLITCMTGKYQLDTTIHLLGSDAIISNHNSSLEIKQISQTELSISILLHIELFDKKIPEEKSKFVFKKQESYSIDIKKSRLELTNGWLKDSPIEYPDFVSVECWLRSDFNKVEFKKQLSKKERRYKNIKEKPDEKLKKYIPIVTNSPDKNWQIYFMFHDNYIVSGLSFIKI